VKISVEIYGYPADLMKNLFFPSEPNRSRLRTPLPGDCFGRFIALVVFLGLGALHAAPTDGTNPPPTVAANPPSTDGVVDFYKNHGLLVSRIEPAPAKNSKDQTTLAYQVWATAPAKLFRLKKVPWKPADDDLARFTKVLVLNDNLPAGTLWDTKHATVVAQAGGQLNFSCQAHWDQTSNALTTEGLPYIDNIFTEAQVSQYQAETSAALAALQTQVQQIKDRVQSETKARLAQVPPDPPKPELLSSKWGGDGSGEPTKSAERIGGSTAAGAAGGALIGQAARDPGMGAGIGAGVGLLGGFIYDTVSKDNDKKKYERQVADENDQRLSEWRAQCKPLQDQRDQIRSDAAAERRRAFTDLANQIAAANGQVENLASPAIAPAPSSNAPASGPVVEPTSDQPSGPIQRP